MSIKIKMLAPNIFSEMCNKFLKLLISDLVCLNIFKRYNISSCNCCMDYLFTLKKIFFSLSNLKRTDHLIREISML